VPRIEEINRKYPDIQIKATGVFEIKEFKITFFEDLFKFIDVLFCATRSNCMSSR